MISIVVPILNEKGLVERLYAEIVAALAGTEIELVFVDDGSTDGTLPSLLALQAADARVVVVELSRNFGHQPAITAGLAAGRGEAVVIMDADLQDPPSVVPRMIDEWKKGA